MPWYVALLHVPNLRAYLPILRVSLTLQSCHLRCSRAGPWPWEFMASWCHIYCLSSCWTNAQWVDLPCTHSTHVSHSRPVVLSCAANLSPSCCRQVCPYATALQRHRLPHNSDTCLRCLLKELTSHLEQHALSLSICFLHWLWSKLFFDKHSWMRQASVLQGSLSVLCDHPNIFIGPHESGVPVSFPMLTVLLRLSLKVLPEARWCKTENCITYSLMVLD